MNFILWIKSKIFKLQRHAVYYNANNPVTENKINYISLPTEQVKHKNTNLKKKAF